MNKDLRIKAKKNTKLRKVGIKDLIEKQEIIKC